MKKNFERNRQRATNPGGTMLDTAATSEAALQLEEGRRRESKAISRRQALAAMGTGILAATAGAMLLPGGEKAHAAFDHPLVITTIAQLRSGATAEDSTVLYHVSDAGREGHFIYDSSDTTSSDDNGMIFVSTTGKRFRRLDADVINVKWFGAKGDNTTDDSAAFLAAIAVAKSRGGGTVYVPSGKFVVTNLLINFHYFTLRGEGRSASHLVNRHATQPVLEIRPKTGTELASGEIMPTITNISIEGFTIKNEINRSGDYPLVTADAIVGSRFTDLFFQNTFGSGYYYGSGMKLVDAYEIAITGCTFRQFQKGYGLDMPNFDENIGNVSLTDCSFMYCGHSLLYARGDGSMANTIVLTNVKFVGWQGGIYHENRAIYYQTTVGTAVTASTVVYVPDASKFANNECVLAGSGQRVMPARIVSRNTTLNTLTLDRAVTLAVNDTIIMGTVAVHAGWRCQEMRLTGCHFEGLDVGLYASNKLGLITLDSMHIGSNSNVVIVDDQVKYLHMMNCRIFYNDDAPVRTDWWTIIRITKLDDDNNVILLDNMYIEGAGAEQLQSFEAKIRNHTSYKPYIRIFDRMGGMQYYSNGKGVTYHDGFTQAYNRTANTLTSKQRWLENGTEKWALEFKDTAGNLGFKLAGQTKDSLLLDASGGHVGSGGSAYNEPHLRLGNFHIWVDNSGRLRYKNGVPTGEADGNLLAIEP
ncbi:glycosyl hydrolase family 28-related protein [Paenibacillus sp. strain BS8-2]